MALDAGKTAKFNPERWLHSLDREFLARFTGEKVVIVGGGVSCSTLFDQVQSEELGRVILTNVALWDPRLKGVRRGGVAGVVWDHDLITAHLSQVASLGFPVFSGNSPNDNDEYLAFLRASNVVRITTNWTEGLGGSFRQFVNGGNSGYAAMQLALLMGFSRLLFVGFDKLEAASAPVWFHEEYGDSSDSEGGPWRSRLMLPGWHRSLNAIMPLLELMGVECYRVKGSTALDIPAIEIEEWVSMPQRSGPASISGANAMLARQGAVVLPFAVTEDLSPAASYGMINACYGGATNSAGASHCRPLPAIVRRSVTVDVDRGFDGTTALGPKQNSRAVGPSAVVAAGVSPTKSVESDLAARCASADLGVVQCDKITGRRRARDAVRFLSRFSQIIDVRAAGDAAFVTWRRTVPVETRECDPIHVFIGSEERQAEAERVLEYSLRRSATAPIKITWLRNGERDELKGWARRSSDGRPWATGFSGYRWAIPELMGWSGRAIYIDVDTLVLGDIAGIGSPAPSEMISCRGAESSVMVINCAMAGAVSWWPSIAKMKSASLPPVETVRRLARLGLKADLGPEWNCLDGDGFSVGETKIIHFTNLETQPWRPHIGEIAYRPHRDQSIESLWFQAAIEARQHEPARSGSEWSQRSGGVMS